VRESESRQQLLKKSIYNYAYGGRSQEEGRQVVAKRENADMAWGDPTKKVERNLPNSWEANALLKE